MLIADEGSLNSHHHLGSREGSHRSSKSHNRHISSGAMIGVDGLIDEDLDVNESEMESDFDDRESFFLLLFLDGIISTMMFLQTMATPIAAMIIHLDPTPIHQELQHRLRL